MKIIQHADLVMIRPYKLRVPYRTYLNKRNEIKEMIDKSLSAPN